MAARQRLGVGIIGAGNISSQYLKAMRTFPVLDIRGIADMRPDVAERKAAEFGGKAASVEALLADPVYGGNFDQTGWRWLSHQPGFPRPSADKTWYRLAPAVQRRSKAT